MKLALLTTIACNMAVAHAADGIRGVMPKLFGADQLADVEVDLPGLATYCGPYSDPPTNEAEDWYCYKNGYPKCCTKAKGSCPTNNKPGCECGGNCNPDKDNDREETRCSVDEDGVSTGCGRADYCRVQFGKCDRTDGVCKPLPNGICNASFDPVCGCNGETYDNECDAYNAGQSISSYGECDNNSNNDREVTRCEYGFDDEDCENSEYCHIQFGRCGRKEGVCKSKPQNCNRVMDQVCGCDGRTYDNECEAYAAGESILKYGRC